MDRERIIADDGQQYAALIVLDLTLIFRFGLIWFGLNPRFLFFDEWSAMFSRNVVLVHLYLGTSTCTMHYVIQSIFNEATVMRFVLATAKLEEFMNT